MSFKNDIKIIVANSLHPLLKKISDETDITMEQLKYIEHSIEKTCRHVLPRAKRICGEKASDNGFCSKHQSTAVVEGTLITKKAKAIAEPKITKTKQQILDMLLTATPEKVTTLKKHQFGFIHESSSIIFENEDDGYVAVGFASGTKLMKLTFLETETCERMGWRYRYESVDNEI
jgi:hypothetical protein